MMKEAQTSGIGDKIREVREKRGITLRALARRPGSRKASSPR